MELRNATCRYNGTFSFDCNSTANGSFLILASSTNAYTLLEQENLNEVTRLIPLIIFLLLIVVSGIPGNGLVCYIYSSQNDMSSSRWFIFFLAFVDLILCIIIVPCEIATTFQQYTFSNATWCRFSAFLNNWALLSLALTLVIVSIDRYRKVCKPLGWQINFRKARILSIIAVSLAFGISIPVLSIYGIYEFRLKGSNITANECSFRTNAAESNFAYIYVSFGMLMFTCALATICILYCFIGAQIKQHTNKAVLKRHNGLTTSLASESDKTITSVFVAKSLTSVSIGDMVSKKKSVKLGEPKSAITNPRQKQPLESTSKETEDEGSINMSEEDTCELDVPKRPISKSQKTKLTNIRRSRAKKATWSMFLISLAFVLSYLPFLGLLLARSVYNSFDEDMSDGWRAVYKFFLRSYFLNCSINPFIYGVSDSKFRRSCKAVLGRIRERFTHMF